MHMDICIFALECRTKIKMLASKRFYCHIKVVLLIVYDITN